MENTSAKIPETSSMPLESIPPLSLDRFCEQTGLSPVTAWRFQKLGWLKTHLLSNRRYILATDLVDFNRRLAAGEFAGKTGNPKRQKP